MEEANTLLGRWRSRIDFLEGPEEVGDPVSTTPERTTDSEEELRRLGIPELYLHARLEDFRREDLKGAPWLFEPEARRGPRDVLVLGENGAGKTHLAAALAALWRGRWCDTLALLRRVRRTFKPQVEESEHSIVEELTTPRVLVLEDITAAKLTDFGLATVLGVVAARVNARRATVVTSFLDLRAIAALDSSLASRLAAFARIELPGPDRRLR